MPAPTASTATVPRDPPTTPATYAGEVPWSDLLRAVLLTLVFGAPLGITMWALLDAARRPQWAWALADRSQVAWMTMIMLGVLLVCAGLGISGWYLWKIRPVIADAEAGKLPS